MARPAVLVPLAVLAAAALVSCSVNLEIGRGDRGPTTTQDREVTADVTAVEFATSGSLRLSVGDPALEVTAGARVLDDLTTEVRGDTLVIDLDRNWLNPGRVDVDLTLPALSSVTLSGSGEVTGDVGGDGAARLELRGSGRIALDGLVADELDVSVGGSGELVVGDVAASATTVTIGGSGRVELAGETDELHVDIPGSGAAEVRDLVARDVEVRLGGSGVAEVNATATLDASISGSGAVRYTGDPQVTRSVTGSGTVSPG